MSKGSGAGRARGSVTARGENTWLLRVSRGRDPMTGKRLRENVTFHGTRSEAKRKLTELLKRADDGLAAVPAHQTLGEWLVEWLTIWCVDVSERTRRDYEQNVRRYVPPVLRARKLSMVTSTDVQALLNDLRDRGLAPRTVALLHATLRRAFNVAVMQGRLARNVVLLAKPPQRVRRAIRTLDREHARRFLSAAEGSRYEALWHLLLVCGLRPAEAFALRWSDLSSGHLFVQHALVRVPGGGWKLKEPKTSGSRRRVVLPESVAKVLHRHRARQVEERLRLGPSFEAHDLIFTTERGSPLFGGNLARRHFKNILEKAGLAHMRPYDLRHTAATLRLALGENPKIVAELLGHTSIAMTLNNYSHVLPEMQEASARRMDALLYVEPRSATRAGAAD